MLRALRRHPAGNVIIVFVIIQAACIAAALILPNDFYYLTEANIAALLDSIPVLGIIALGVAVLMICGEFDLSVGSVLVFTALVMGQLVELGVGPWGGAALALVLGSLIGLLNLNPAVERSVLPFLGAIVSPSARPEAVGARVDGPVVGLRGTSSALPPGSDASDPLRSTAPHF